MSHWRKKYCKVFVAVNLIPSALWLLGATSIRKKDMTTCQDLLYLQMLANTEQNETSVTIIYCISSLSLRWKYLNL